jgi:hypothetical protein
MPRLIDVRALEDEDEFLWQLGLLQTPPFGVRNPRPKPNRVPRVHRTFTGREPQDDTPRMFVTVCGRGAERALVVPVLEWPRADLCPTCWRIPDAELMKGYEHPPVCLVPDCECDRAPHPHDVPPDRRRDPDAYRSRILSADSWPV